MNLHLCDQATGQCALRGQASADDANPSLPALLVALCCEDPLCSFQAARAIAKMLYSQRLSNSPSECSLPSIFAQLLPGSTTAETEASSSSAAAQPATPRRGCGAVQILAQLMRLCIRSSSALQDQSSSARQPGESALWFIESVPPFLTALCSACLPVTVSRDALVEGELLSWLLDFAHALLDQPQSRERDVALSAFVSSVGQHVDGILALPASLSETAVLLLVALSQMSLLLPVDASRNVGQDYRILSHTLSRLQQSPQVGADEDEEASNDQRSLWSLLSCSLRLCANSLTAAQREQVLASLSVLVSRPGTNGAQSLVELWSEDDEQLIDTLLQLAHAVPALWGESRAAASPSAATASSSSSAASSPSRSAVFSALDPFSLFFSFLLVLSFDSSVVLDYLISTETRCLEYLMTILKMAESREGFETMMERCNAAAANDSDDEPGIDSAMSCLIRLRLSMQRLVDKVSDTRAQCCSVVAPS